MKWPYCPSCATTGSMSLVRDRNDLPVAWICSTCKVWAAQDDQDGLTQRDIDKAMRNKGYELDANRVIFDIDTGARITCAEATCDLILRNGIAKCSCGLNGIDT